MCYAAFSDNKYSPHEEILNGVNPGPNCSVPDLFWVNMNFNSRLLIFVDSSKRFMFLSFDLDVSLPLA